MASPFGLTPQATDDLDEIWWFIAQDSVDAANRVEQEIVATCRRLARHPLIGTKRPDITPPPVRFWTVTRFPNYVIVYLPETTPLQTIAVLHGKRDLENAAQPFSVIASRGPQRESQSRPALEDRLNQQHDPNGDQPAVNPFHKRLRF